MRRHRLTEKDIHRIVRKVLNENLTVHEGFVREMYQQLRNYEKADCEMRGYDEFKEKLKEATDKLEEILFGSHRHKHRKEL